MKASISVIHCQLLFQPWSLPERTKDIFFNLSNYQNFTYSKNHFACRKLERKFHDIPIVAFNQIVGDNLLGWLWCTVKLLSHNVCQAPQAHTALPNIESKQCRQGKFSGEEYFQIGPDSIQQCTDVSVYNLNGNVSFFLKYSYSQSMIKNPNIPCNPLASICFAIIIISSYCSMVNIIMITVLMGTIIMDWWRLCCEASLFQRLLAKAIVWVGPTNDNRKVCQ